MNRFYKKVFDYSDGKAFRASFARRFVELGGPVQMALFGKPRYGTNDDWFLVTDFDFAHVESLSPGGWATIHQVFDGGWDLLLGDPEIEKIIGGGWLNSPR